MKEEGFNMRVCSVVWNGEEAKIKFTKEFLGSDWLIKADALVDIRFDVEKLYEQTLKEHSYAKTNG
jgi:hypothetical protein